ncbi:MAG: VWA domain-containing protein, partial [Pyrinomonadaceae bacterium]
PLYAQQQTPPQADDVVKVSTNLVQVDAIVTDNSGNPVTNLTSKDFDILQDGKPQTITGISYISRSMSAKNTNLTSTNDKFDKKNSLPPIAANRSPEFGRILTFVVDDGGCDATFAGINAVKEGLQKFINEQMQPNDSVAIYQTRAGSSLLQQYTSDKTRLLNIARKIRWYPPDGFCNNISGSDYEPASNNATLKPGVNFENDRDKEKREAREDYARDRQVTGVIGVLRYAISGLREVGGRKILFLMADSLPISNGRTTFPNALDAARDVTAQANRAAVVINTIDVRGLSVPMAGAADSFGVKEDVGAVDKVLAKRAVDDNTRQSGLFYAANETGGKFYKNMNLLNVPIEKALQSETGYYLIGYQPEGDTFEGKKFHKIEIKLNRPDLKVSSRSGFYGVTDEAIRPKTRTGSDHELYDALSAPLPNADLDVQLSAYFANTPDKGNFIHAVIYIDGKDISFVSDADGKKKAVFDIVAVTLDDKNKVIDDSNHTNTVHIPVDKIAQVQQNGLIYMVDVPVKNDGVYTFRTALRDAGAKRVGAASQAIEVPDLKKDKLFVSGLIISGVDANGKIYPPETAKADNDFSTVVSKAIPAIRQFRRNTIIGYAYTIYNAKISSTTNQPNLTIQTNLYRDGKLMSEGKPQAAQIEKQPDIKRIRDYSYLRLNPNVPVGDYTLQIIIKDLATNQTANQSVNFEVVE